MSEHLVTVTWKRTSADFSYANYNRAHEWDFGHDKVVPASAAPDYKGDESLVDPEQAFTASLSSCHMLTFLALASKQGFIVESYVDHAVGVLGKNDKGQMAMTTVTLRPKISFGGTKSPTAAELADLHDKSHHYCFIANSVTTKIIVE